MSTKAVSFLIEMPSSVLRLYALPLPKGAMLLLTHGRMANTAVSTELADRFVR